MHRPAFVLVLALAVALTAAAPRASAVAPRPRYAAGDFWTYATNLSQAFDLVFDGNTTVTVGELANLTIQGEPVAALEVSLAGGGRFAGNVSGFGTLSGAWTLTGTEHWETGGWKSVRSFLRLTAEGEIPSDPMPIAFTFQVRNETTRRIASDTFAWPIAEGSTGETRARWNVSQNLTIAFEGFPPVSNETAIDADFVTSYRHNGTARITVPAGTFETHRIEESGPEGGVRVRWYADRVGNDVLEEDYNATGGRIASSALRDFRYRAGEPAPPFPWLTAIVAGLVVAAVVLGAGVALRRRGETPTDVWMPPEKDAPPRGPASP